MPDFLKQALEIDIRGLTDYPFEMSVHFCHGQNKITVPCYRGLNILGHAQIEEVDLGSQCGGHGICGRDRIQISIGKENVSLPNETEHQHLSVQEIKEGWRLACQTWPHRDEDEISVEF